METKEKSKQETPQQPPVPRSCRKNSNPNATFVQDMKDHFDEFMSASMEDHKNCFINTLGKMFGKSPKEESASSSAANAPANPAIEAAVLATTSK